MPLTTCANRLEALYRRYNRRRWVHPDPVEFLYAYNDLADREVAAVVAALLAYGRVGQILRSVGSVLDRLSPHPARFLRDVSTARLERTFADFRHRFQKAAELTALLGGLKGLLGRYGSLEACFAAGAEARHETVLPALTAFVKRLDDASGAGVCGHLLADPARGSACKRWHLMLRWLVRADRVDPGGWRCVRPGQLIVPLDTHMHRIARALGATQRKSADARTAQEVTAAFRRLCPQDPVRYDFALTRFGIHPDRDLRSLLEFLGCEEHERSGDDRTVRTSR